MLQTWVPDRIIIILHIQAKTWNDLNVSNDVHVSTSSRFLIFPKVVIDKSSNRRGTGLAQSKIKNRQEIASLTMFHASLEFS